MRVVVTGAAGMIGSEVTASLGRLGYDVVGVHRSPGGYQPKGAIREQLDLTEPGATSALQDLAPDTIVHCAASLPTAFTGEAASQVADINRAIDLSVKGVGCRIIYLSSVSVYGLGPQRFSEEGPTEPVGPYAASKAATESLLGPEDAGLRVSAAYGPRQRTSTVLRLFVARALAGEDLLYHGSGRRSQDFVHVSDVAAAVGAIVADPALGGIYNVASAGLFRFSEAVGKLKRPTVPVLPIGAGPLDAPARRLGLPHVPSDVIDLLRFGHAIDTAKLTRAGFEPDTDQAACLRALCH